MAKSMEVSGILAEVKGFLIIGMSWGSDDMNVNKKGWPVGRLMVDYIDAGTKKELILSSAISFQS